MHECCAILSEQLPAIPWLEQLTFWLDDDICFEQQPDFGF